MRQWVRSRNKYGKGSKWHILKEQSVRDDTFGLRTYTSDIVKTIDGYGMMAQRGSGDVLLFSEDIPTRGSICGGCLKIWLDTNSQTR